MPSKEAEGRDSRALWAKRGGLEARDAEGVGAEGPWGGQQTTPLAAAGPRGLHAALSEAQRGGVSLRTQLKIKRVKLLRKKVGNTKE